MRRTVGVLLTLCGSLALTWSGATWALGQQERIERAQAIPVRSFVEQPSRGETLGLLQFPRLGLSVVAVEGDDAASLMSGAGHLPDTPMPWRDGNSVFAGHRDTDFASLKDVARGDILVFRVADATVEYVVRDTLVVDPSDVSVLQSTHSAALTLITCYPFTYIGPAPQRFVVRAYRTHIHPHPESRTVHHRIR